MMWDSGDCYSAEWPAVIVLHQVRESKKMDNIVTLYLQISRARVYCVIVLFPEEGKVFKTSHMSGLLDKLSGHVQIIPH